jgi:hypothetical protein
MITIYIPVFAVILGLILYFVTPGKVSEVGRILFAVGILVLMLHGWKW